MTAVDALTDEELYAHFVEECIVALMHDFAMLDVLADAWKRSGLNIDFHSFVGGYCSNITGIPDFEHFINNEILNPRIAHAQVELIPQRWLDKFKSRPEDQHCIHEEHSHAPSWGSELTYYPGRF